MIFRCSESEGPHLFIPIKEVVAIEWFFDSNDTKLYGIEIHQNSHVFSRVMFRDSYLGQKCFALLLMYMIENKNCDTPIQQIIDLCEELDDLEVAQKVDKFIKETKLFKSKAPQKPAPNPVAPPQKTHQIIDMPKSLIPATMPAMDDEYETGVDDEQPLSSETDDLILEDSPKKQKTAPKKKARTTKKKK